MQLKPSPGGLLDRRISPVVEAYPKENFKESTLPKKKIEIVTTGLWDLPITNHGNDSFCRFHTITGQRKMYIENGRKLPSIPVMHRFHWK
jgi:hypothetical protein